jgi:hypothetical protein
MYRGLYSVYHLFICSSFFILLANINHHVARSQPTVTLKAGSRDITYRLVTDTAPEKTCPSKLSHTVQANQTRDLDLQKFIGICIPQGGKALVSNCPDPRSSNKKKQPQSFVNSYNRVHEKCSISSGHSGGDILLGGWDSSIPYIVSPRYTKILSGKPVFLRWNRTSENASYKVVIKSVERSESWVPTEVSTNKNEVVEIRSSEKLKPGTYQLIVQSDNQKGSEQEVIWGDKTRDGISVLQFRVVPEAERIEVENEIMDLAELTSPNNKELDIARTYAEKGFYTEAIQILESLNKDMKSTEIYQFLGDFYSQVGLSALAVRNYRISNTEYAKKQLNGICTEFSQQTSNQRPQQDQNYQGVPINVYPAQLPGCLK